MLYLAFFVFWIFWHSFSLWFWIRFQSLFDQAHSNSRTYHFVCLCALFCIRSLLILTHFLAWNKFLSELSIHAFKSNANLLNANLSNLKIQRNNERKRNWSKKNWNQTKIRIQLIRRLLISESLSAALSAVYSDSRFQITLPFFQPFE